MAGQISYTLKNDFSELDRLRQKLDEFGKSLELPKKCLFEIQLAVEEHFTNIVSYGYSDKVEHRIKIDLFYQNHTVEICIEDDGTPFNPLTSEPPDVKCPLEKR